MTDAVVTQISLEEWTSGADARTTQIALEEWGSVAVYVPPPNVGGPMVTLIS